LADFRAIRPENRLAGKKGVAVFFLFDDAKKRRAAKIAAVERALAADPAAGVEVDPETAESMGAFVEDAVGLDDFYRLEPGSLDFFPQTADVARGDERD
jgi:hypothetical protein